MPTQCTPEGLGFSRVEGRRVVAAFDGGAVTSDAGALLLGATDRAIGLVNRFAACFRDGRAADRVVHGLGDLIGQRVFALALGYEDLNDHDEVRFDPVMRTLSGRLAEPLAGKSTLNRLEHAPTDGADRYRRIGHDPEAIADLFVDLFIEAHPRAPKRIVLDLDATDDPLHGRQEGRFFHGYYDCYCYMPLYVVCGEHLLAARLRRSNIDASAGAVEEVARIVAHIRRHWPDTRIVLRADSGFARDALMAWCEDNGVDFLFGLARNPRLAARIEPEMRKAESEARRTGRPARRFRDFRWSTRKSWTRHRRVIGKAEWTGGSGNPRFVVTSLKACEIDARTLYEQEYCARGDMENRIKECQGDLFADRTSTGTMRANQLRLWFASMAYVLVTALRRIALHDTGFERASPGTIRLKLLKIGARVTTSVRRVKVSMASGHPWQATFALAHERLSAAAA